MASKIQASKIQKAINDINKLNSINDLPFVSPIVSGQSNSSSITCIPRLGGSGRWCGSGYVDHFPSLFCEEEEEREEEEGEEEEEEEREEEEEGTKNKFTEIEIIEKRFRWGYTAE